MCVCNVCEILMCMWNVCIINNNNMCNENNINVINMY